MAHADAKPVHDVLQFFCRHLVGLFVTYRHKDAPANEADQFAPYSGTLITIDGNVHFLTAGHILRDLKAALESDAVEIKEAVLADTFGPNRVCDLPIPFDLKSAHFFFIDDDAQGLDFGVMSLAPYYVRLLAKNRVVALDEQNWVHQSRLDFDFYRMLGFPEELASTRITASGNALVAPVMLPVCRLPAPPPERHSTFHPQFVGQLDEDLKLRSVKGMSGGPILGFKHDKEGLRYWVVALQSSWDPDRRIVYGCSLPILASMMAKWTKEV